jgi:3-hydroxyacyl-CoA dehydrogenase
MGTIPQTSAPDQATSAEPMLIRRATVLGAGTMGSRITAHLANSGIPVLLLDLAPKDESAQPLAHSALDALAKSKPAAFTVRLPPRSLRRAHSTPIFPKQPTATG